MKNKILVILGLYIALDGIISIFHFSNATYIEQLFRFIRAMIGVVIMSIGYK